MFIRKCFKGHSSKASQILGINVYVVKNRHQSICGMKKDPSHYAFTMVLQMAQTLMYFFSSAQIQS